MVCVVTCVVLSRWRMAEDVEIQACRCDSSSSGSCVGHVEGRARSRERDSGKD